MRSSSRYIWKIAVFVGSYCLIANVAFGQEASGSLDSVWEDAKVTPSASQTTDLSAAAPLCTVDDFKKSSLILEGGWPQVGPFKSQPGNDSEFADEHNNKLKIQVLGGQIAQAQLNVAKEKPTPRDLLDVQLDTDFLLESLGAKASSIAMFNKLISKEQEQIWTRTHPLQVAAGHYLVSIKKQLPGQDQPSGYCIQINSQDASSKVLKEQSSASLAIASDTNAPPATGTAPDTKVAEVACTKLPEQSESAHLAEVQTTKKGDGTKKGADEPNVAGKIVAKSDPLKNSFMECICNWQNIKKKAVKLKQTSQLACALDGKALSRQTEAVKWLAANQESCDLTAQLVSLDRYTQVLPDKKYIVQATVREQSKYIDDKSGGRVLKEQDSTYKVSYTIEKVKTQWLITDYSVTSSSVASSK